MQALIEHLTRYTRYARYARYTRYISRQALIEHLTDHAPYLFRAQYFKLAQTGERRAVELICRLVRLLRMLNAVATSSAAVPGLRARVYPASGVPCASPALMTAVRHRTLRTLRTLGTLHRAPLTTPIGSPSRRLRRAPPRVWLLLRWGELLLH